MTSSTLHPKRPLMTFWPGLMLTSALMWTAACGCSGSGTSEDGEAGSAASPQDEAPPWIAAAGSPSYSIQLSPGGDPVVMDADGEVLINLGLVYSGSYGEAEGESGCSGAGTCLETDQKRLGPWSWGESRAEGGQQVTTLSAPYEGPRAKGTAVWSITEGDPVLRLEFEVAWTVDAYPDREALLMTLPDQAAALARDLRFTRLAPGQTVHTDRWTPHQVVAGSGSRAFYLVAHGLDGMEVESIKHGTALVMELDDARNHPFRPVSECGADAQNVVHSAFDRHKRSQGDTLKVVVEVGLGHTWSPVLSRYPEGREAAVALVDTAPLPDAKHLSALLWGHSNPDDPRYGNGGILGNNLTLTRSLAPTPQAIGDAEIARVARVGAEQGVGFAAHAAGLADPSLLAQGLGTLKEEIATHTWIDHDPARDCSSFQASGWRNSALVEQLVEGGYRSIWSNLPTRTTGVSINLLRPERPEIRTPLLWSHGRSGHDFMMFNALDLHQPTLQRRLNNGALKKLARERGVLIARTRIESADPSAPGAAPPLLTRDDGELVSSPALEQILFELSDAQQNGLTWVTTIDDLTGWLTQLEHVRQIPLADGRLKLVNTSDRDLKGLTLLLPGGDYQARLNDTPVTGRRVTSAPRKLRDTLIWFDLAKNSSALLTIEDDKGRRLQPLVPIHWDLSARR